jgi:hypothetical protein
MEPGVDGRGEFEGGDADEEDASPGVSELDDKDSGLFSTSSSFSVESSSSWAGGGSGFRGLTRGAFTTLRVLTNRDNELENSQGRE